MTATRSRKPTRRRSQRVVRWDRVILAAALPLALIIGLTLLISRGCSACTPSAVEPAMTAETTARIDSTAHADADSAAIHPQGSMERQRALFAIHARTAELRRRGFTHAADRYRSAVNSILSHPQ